MRKTRLLGILIVIVIVAAIAAFAFRASRTPVRLPAVPEELTRRAVIPGIPGARYWVGQDIEPFVRAVLAARERENAFLTRSGRKPCTFKCLNAQLQK